MKMKQKQIKNKIIKMREKDIRPDYLMNKYKNLCIKDIQRLLKHRNKFIKISCPACQSNNYQFIFKKSGFIFVVCKKCETVFINPRPRFETLAKFYATSKSIQYWNDKIFPISENVRRNLIFLPRAKRVVELSKKHKVPTKVLVDVGAGFGTFNQEIKKLGIFDRVIAVEPSSSLAETCRQKKIETIEKPIEKVSPKEIKGVSIITVFELIEHLFWPKDFLLACAKVLPKAGLLVLTAPNIKGFDLITLGKLSDNIGGPNHLNYFNPQSLSYLLKNCGFEIIEVETPGKLDAEIVRKKALAGKFNISRHAFLKEILIEKWETVGGAFQEFLANNMLSSHLWIVAKKIKSVA